LALALTKINPPTRATPPMPIRTLLTLDMSGFLSR
jgi:hypothetical protein